MTKQYTITEDDFIVIYDDSNESCSVECTLDNCDNVRSDISLEGLSDAQQEEAIKSTISKLIKENSAPMQTPRISPAMKTPPVSRLNTLSKETGSVTMESDAFQFIKVAGDMAMKISDSVKPAIDKSKRTINKNLTKYKARVMSSFRLRREGQ